MNKFCLALLLFASLALADEASDFCQNGPPGRYCTSDLTGYYECTGRDSYKFKCYSGTQCACFVGPSCSSVELVGPDYSPCQRIEELPKFPTLTISLNATTVDVDPIRETVYMYSYKLYSDRENGRFRPDILNNDSSIQQSDYYLGESSGNAHYNVFPGSSTCAADTQPVPSFGIPSGYRFFNISTYNGVPVNIYYFRAGGQNNGEDTTYAQYITTRPDANGFVTPILNYGFLNSPREFRARRVYNTYSNAVYSVPKSAFVPPSYCNASSSGLPSSTSGSTQTSTSGSSSTGNNDSCSSANRGYMRCSGESSYQVCDHDQWQNAQTCQTGLKCRSSGNYIYCA